MVIVPSAISLHSQAHPGKENSADALSRLPVSPAEHHDVTETRAYAHSIATEAVSAALKAQEVERALEKNPTLHLLREAVTSGNWTRLSGTMFKALAEELLFIGQLVLRCNRIILPKSLWKRTIVLAHEGNQEMVRRKARLREKVW